MFSFYSGVLLSSGRLWQFQRRFTLHQFREHGIGKSRFQDKIIEETSHLLEEFRRNVGKPTNPARFISSSVSNILCSVIFGKRFNYSDNDFCRIIVLLDTLFEVAGSGAMNLFIPFLTYFQRKYHRSLSAGTQMKVFILKMVNARKINLDNPQLDNYIDVYLTELENATNNNVKKEDLAADKTLYQTVTQLFTAGAETTVTALKWALLYMMVHPEFQSRAQKEIDAVVGRNRLPRIDDALPFTEAIIMEVQRHISILPLGVPHIAAADTTLQGRNIPKGTLLFCNIWGIHHDPDSWTNPDQFNPERFLDADGNICQPKEYIPFSIGKTPTCTSIFIHIEVRGTFKKFWSSRSNCIHCFSSFTFTLNNNP